MSSNSEGLHRFGIASAGQPNSKASHSCRCITRDAGLMFIEIGAIKCGEIIGHFVQSGARERL